MSSDDLSAPSSIIASNANIDRAEQSTLKKPYMTSALCMENPHPSNLSSIFIYKHFFIRGFNYSDLSQPNNLNATYNNDENKRRVFVSGFDTQIVSTPSLNHQYRYISPLGFLNSSYGATNLYNHTQKIGIAGFNTSAFGSPSIINKNKEIKATGFSSQIFGTPSKVYNLKQILNLNTRGINSAVFGTAYFQGGVKYVGFIGFNAAILPNPVVINTKADQYANLNNRGISPPAIPSHNVSPRILYPNGILAWQFGTPLIQRSPSPKGFDTSSYGVAWVSHSPRNLHPSFVEAFLSGYPKVFDPTQKIYVTGANTVIAGGVFGDTSIRNTRRIITVSGFYAQSFSDWGVVESNLRNIVPNGLDNQNFGSNTIRNKTPSIAPIGINSFTGLNAVISYRIRTLKPSGWYQPKLGNHTLTKTPELKPSGFNQSTFGSTWISNKTRSIYAGLGRESLAIGESKIWHYSRSIRTSGLEFSQYGAPRVEHGRRTILAKGSAHTTYGNNSWVSYAVRSLLPSSIAYPNIPNHRVGGTQRINVFGYVATLFGSRIIPESQSIYPQGFINPFGISAIDLWKKYIKPTGFLSTGQEGGHRFGTHKFWNLRQYIVQFYDGDSGLVPPKWTGWTGIENRNKTIGAIGSNFARVAEPYIENKARLLLPFGIDAQSFGKPMIADRIRYLKLQGLESPYFSGWSVIYNAAPVIGHKGFKADAFGLGSVVNTRRYFNRIGNFESLAMGTPMVADRIRTLKFEQRYTIAPPYIPIHRVDLYTRYVEEVGRFDDHQAFGQPALTIHWKIITPRWTLRNAYGTASVKNLTPELGTRGRNSEEFGGLNIRTQWCELLQLGSETVAWGRNEIAFRDRQFSVNGFTQWNVPRPRVIKTGIPPYYPQYIWLDSVEIDGEKNGGHGIPEPGGQVALPSLRTNVVFTSGFSATKFGEDIQIQSNGILIDYGISMPLLEPGPLVALKNRVVSVENGINAAITMGKPRFSPHTIYAVMEAPESAKQNHPPGNLHYVNSDAGMRKPGEVFGRTTVTLKHRVLRNLSVGHLSRYGVPEVQLKRRIIEVRGMQSYRMGWASVGDGTQKIIQFGSFVMSLFGQTTLKHKEQLHRTVRASGFNSFGISSAHWISHLHRTLNINGFSSQQMGTWRSGDTPFMWQGLRVGELVRGSYGGFENLSFGKAWISNRIRELDVQGFESFVMEYDYTQFDKRMRVTGQVLPKPKLLIKPVGVDALLMSVPNIKPAAHYIRPDGNADQYRKGAF